MFEWCSSQVINIWSPGCSSGATIALRDQVDGLGSAAGQNNLGATAGIDEVAQLVAGSFVEFGRAMTQRMNSAMHIRMIFALVACNRVNNRRGCCAEAALSR